MLYIVVELPINIKDRYWNGKRSNSSRKVSFWAQIAVFDNAAVSYIVAVPQKHAEFYIYMQLESLHTGELLVNSF